MNSLAKVLTVSAVTGALVLSGTGAMAATADGHSAVAASTSVAAPQGVGAASASAARVGYTFDHATTAALYQYAVTQSTSAFKALCESTLPASTGAVLCPMLSGSLSGVAALGAPGPQDKLYVGVQLGWPPLVVKYVR
ncbi:MULTISPECIES: hypothetical protein [unclassified Streptomyces]|uniref:hypothetical protein n=1 Tax=unclassified Streptomyces TaxID=2593676 RepID=UPI001906D62C|nr:hypothetical protein [Streptomyces sp. HSG2]